jgi:hypothetical protein
MSRQYSATIQQSIGGQTGLQAKKVGKITSKEALDLMIPTGAVFFFFW